MTDRRRFIEGCLHAVGAVCGFIAGGRGTAPERKVYRDTWRCRCGEYKLNGAQAFNLLNDLSTTVLEHHSAENCRKGDQWFVERTTAAAR